MPSIIPYRTLGKTGETFSAIGVGGWHLGLKRVDEQLSFRIIRTAIDRGINFLDNCWDYNEGASETRMGKALRDGYRQRVFLMTKIDGRSYSEAMRQLDKSLERLQTDCIDLVQHHEILRYDDPYRIFDGEVPIARLSTRKKRVRSDISASRDTRIQTFTCTCSKWPDNTASYSTPCKCR